MWSIRLYPFAKVISCLLKVQSGAKDALPFPRYLQSYLNDVHLVPYVVLRGNELLTKVLMDKYT